MKKETNIKSGVGVVIAAFVLTVTALFAAYMAGDRFANHVVMLGIVTAFSTAVSAFTLLEIRKLLQARK